MDRKQRFFVWLTAIFVAALVTGDFIGGKFWVLFGHTLSAGIIPFPLTFVLTDIVNEFYGTEGARRLTFVGLGAAIFVWAVITAGAPPADQPRVAHPGRRVPVRVRHLGAALRRVADRLPHRPAARHQHLLRPAARHRAPLPVAARHRLDGAVAGHRQLRGQLRVPGRRPARWSSSSSTPPTTTSAS